MLPFAFYDLDDRLSQSSLDLSGSSIPMLVPARRGDRAGVNLSVAAFQSRWVGLSLWSWGCLLKGCMSCNGFPYTFPVVAFFLRHLPVLVASFTSHSYLLLFIISSVCSSTAFWGYGFPGPPLQLTAAAAGDVQEYFPWYSVPHKLWLRGFQSWRWYLCI